MRPVISINKEHEQTPLLIQREVGMAVRLSIEAVTREPLPEQMALLLLRLALAESLHVALAKELDEEAQSALSRWVEA
ncbi:hypothetical protein [Methylocystis sp. S23]|jgi:hypothetical protein